MCGAAVASGAAVDVHAVTLIAITVTAVAWMYACLAARREHVLKRLWIPLAIWLFAGSLDLLATAGVYDRPHREGNPLVRSFFTALGFLGPVVFSCAWISLWMVVLLLVDIGLSPLSKNLAAFAQLTLVYALALGHFFAYAGWAGWQDIYYYGFTVNQTHPLLNHMLFGVFYVSWLLAGGAASVLHLMLSSRARSRATFTR